MAVIFQTALMRLALCGLATSLLVLVLRSRMARDTFARLLSIWRSLTAFGRVAVCSFLLVGVLVGGDKTNGVNNLPPQMMSPMAQQGHGFWLTGLLVNGNLANVMNPVQSQTTFAERKTANWNIRGAWKDSFWLDFEDGWVFPWGTNHLSGVEVVSFGQVWATPFDTNAVASAGAPFEIVPGLTTFTYEFTPSNSYRFVWTDAAINRDTNNLVSASLELFRNGDVSVTTNGVAALVPRTLPFPHSGFGQDDEWVTANFTNATEILAVGYPQWVDSQVGDGLANGLYKLSVTVADDPPETTFLSVGDLSVAVTNAGEYVFLLEKGSAYDLTVFPPSSNVTISAVDDVPTMRRTPMMRSFGDAGDGQWVPDSGDFWTDYAAGMGYARLWWLPWLCGSPDVVHIDPTTGPVTFHANLFDYRGGAASFLWAGSDALTIASPNSQTTAVTADLADWRLANLSVTASFGFDRSLTSYLDVSYGTNDSPQVSCSLSVQSVHFINEGDRPERIYPVSVSLLCPVETNGVVNISHEGSDGTLFWSDASATQPLSSLTGISLSSVTEESGGASYTFYMTSPNIGSGSFTASFTLPSGETRGAAKSYRAIEPIRKLVCSEIEDVNDSIVNPSRITFENPAALRVAFNGQGYQADEIAWSVVSGPGTVSENSGTNVFVEATATSGTIVVEARFNNDDIQPRFVLPIVSEKTYVVRAFVVKTPVGVQGWTEDRIRSHIEFANRVFAQIGVKFCLTNVTMDVGTTHEWDFVCTEIVHDEDGNDVEVLNDHAKTLLNTYSSGDCIELYYTGNIRSCNNNDPVAFRNWRGILIGGSAEGRDVAHEIGHAFGLVDCLVENGSAVVSDSGNEISAASFHNHTEDWGQESGRGFYEKRDTIGSTIKSLLMYGDNDSDGVDIPAGRVRGVNDDIVPSVGFLSVGVNDINYNESEVYSR